VQAIRSLLHELREAKRIGDEVELIGIGAAGPAVLHAAYLEDPPVTVRLRDSITSWLEDVAIRPTEANLMGHVVPGALEHYDLPDLARALGDRLVIEERR